MPRILPALIALALTVMLLPAGVAAAAKAPKQTAHKHATVHHRHGTRGYGFLPGYRPPEVIERERALHAWRSGPRFYGPAWPRFYHGRWNGGGFGPCYSQTPIGYVWTCGR